jgi:DNA-binding winged helix-turn-helix (wHTH) protein
VSTVVKCHKIVCYLQIIMNNYIKYSFRFLVIFGLFLCMISCSKESNEDASAIVKVALRNVGHQLLSINQDSISVVKPIVKIENLQYQLSFEEPLEIHPDSLIAFLKNSFQKANLPEHYLVEVLQCKDNEVAYSFQMKQNIENGIIPCRGRQLKKDCYLIHVRFTKRIETNCSYSYTWFVSIFLFGVFGIITLLYFKRKAKVSSEENSESFTFIGTYKFYPEQNKLIKEAVEISLSKKECELLAIFIAQPNQIIKREDLTKKVWEDNGVFVGRSLDTYISKLRIKLKADESVKLINIHGVGYKLEID